MMGNTAVLS